MLTMEQGAERKRNSCLVVRIRMKVELTTNPQKGLFYSKTVKL